MTNKKTNKQKSKSSVTYNKTPSNPLGLPFGFLTELKMEESDDGNYELIDDLLFNDVKLGVIIVKKGFVTDFASIPSALRWLIKSDEYDIRAPSVIHDMLYSVPHTTTREEADSVLYRAMIARGAPKWKAGLVYAGLRVGGASHYGN